MTTSLILACIWCVLAITIAMFPSRDHHWRAAYGLIAIGLPLLVYVFYENGWVIGVLVLAAACSVLRWPLIYLFRWVKARTVGKGDGV